MQVSVAAAAAAGFSQVDRNENPFKIEYDVKGRLNKPRDRQTSRTTPGSAYLVVFASFLNADQTDYRLAVLQSLVEDGVRVTLNPLLLCCWGFVILLHLLPLHAFKCLGEEKQNI